LIHFFLVILSFNFNFSFIFYLILWFAMRSFSVSFCHKNSTVMLLTLCRIFCTTFLFLQLTSKVLKIIPFHKWGSCGLMIIASDFGLGGWGSISSQGKSLTPGFIFKWSSNKMVTSVRIYWCAVDLTNKKIWFNY